MSQHQPVCEYIQALVEEFLSRHDGFSLGTSEEHSAPSKWSEGSRTLTIRIVCPTGEPTLPREQD